MTCQVCLDRPCRFGNSLICSCCGEIICEYCSIEIFLHNFNKLECPVCRSTYNLSNDILISNMEKTCQRQGEYVEDAKVCLAALYFGQGKYVEARELLESFKDSIYNYKGGYFYLAMLYRYGLGGVKNSRKAFNMFLKISWVGRSLLMLGEMFIKGEGTIKNIKYGKSLIRIHKKKLNFPIHYKTGQNVII